MRRGRNTEALVGDNDTPGSPPAERDRDEEEVPETPPTKPSPVPVEEPPAPGQEGPYVVGE
jgi:hypothetical protein